MIQPFLEFTDVYLRQLITISELYLVSQTYKRADHFEEGSRTSILLTSYKDKGLADVHYNAVRGDKYSSIINLAKPEHLAKVKEMMQGDNYKLFWCVVKSANDLNKRLDTSYKLKIRRYLSAESSWRIAADETVNVKFEVIFGELFLNLRWREKRLRIKFAEIERF